MSAGLEDSAASGHPAGRDSRPPGAGAGGAPTVGQLGRRR